MFYITKRRIEKKIEKATKQAAKIIRCMPENHKDKIEDFTFKINLSKYCYIIYRIDNFKELMEMENE